MVTVLHQLITYEMCGTYTGPFEVVSGILKHSLGACKHWWAGPVWESYRPRFSHQICLLLAW